MSEIDERPDAAGQGERLPSPEADDAALRDPDPPREAPGDPQAEALEELTRETAKTDEPV